MMPRWCSPGIRPTAAGLCFALAFVTAPIAQSAKPVTYRVIALAEPGQTPHQGFVDAAMDWLQTFPIENDEWYTYDRSPRPDVQVLASVDENSYEPARTVKMGDHPVIWTNPHYKARNVYFQFGHNGALLQNTYFTQVFLNAIHWAAGH
jgi:hypothetical protein